MKKGLSILLALLMVLTTINVPVFAEDISVGDWSALADALNNANGGTVTLENNIASVSDETSFTEAIADGGSVTLHNDIVITNAITIPADVTVEIDLNGQTLKLTAGDAHFLGTSTIKNGTIDITGCVAKSDCIIGVGNYSNSATLNLENVNITGNG